MKKLRKFIKLLFIQNSAFSRRCSVMAETEYIRVFLIADSERVLVNTMREKVKVFC